MIVRHYIVRHKLGKMRKSEHISDFLELDAVPWDAPPASHPGKGSS